MSHVTIFYIESGVSILFNLEEKKTRHSLFISKMQYDDFIN